MTADFYTVNYKQIAEDETEFDKTVMSIDFDNEEEATKFYGTIEKRCGYGIGYYVELIHYFDEDHAVLVSRFEF